jgi:hypothetical protein
MNTLLVESICIATDTVCAKLRTMYATDTTRQQHGCRPLRHTELYIHGGGFAGLWAIGSLEIFRVLEQVQAIRIHMIHGYSIGAIFAVFYICAISTRDTIDAYCRIQQHIHDVSGLRQACTTVLKQTLPENAHLLCNGRVRIGVTRKFPLWYKEETYFRSRNVLIEYLVLSAAVPGITHSLWDSMWNYIDGVFGYCIWGWTPPQPGRCGIELVPPWLGYTHVFSPDDPYLYGLITNGLTDIVYFLQNKPTRYIRMIRTYPWQLTTLKRWVTYYTRFWRTYQ